MILRFFYLSLSGPVYSTTAVTSKEKMRVKEGKNWNIPFRKNMRCKKLICVISGKTKLIIIFPFLSVLDLVNLISEMRSSVHHGGKRRRMHFWPWIGKKRSYVYLERTTQNDYFVFFFPFFLLFRSSFFFLCLSFFCNFFTGASGSVTICKYAILQVIFSFSSFREFIL